MCDRAFASGVEAFAEKSMTSQFLKTEGSILVRASLPKSCRAKSAAPIPQNTSVPEGHHLPHLSFGFLQSFTNNPSHGVNPKLGNVWSETAQHPPSRASSFDQPALEEYPVRAISVSARIRARRTCSGFMGSSRSVVALIRRPPSGVRSVRISRASVTPAA